jgi:hypothetical protein
MAKFARRLITTALLSAVAATVILRREGHKVPGYVPLKCAKGHRFTALWVPGALPTLKGGIETQYRHCPVGNHWGDVTLVPARKTVTEEEN